MTTNDRVIRFDQGELRVSRRTPEGFLLAEGQFAKPGILTYRKTDGSVVREYIPAEELFRADSLGTIGRKPVTKEHPPGQVNSDNVQDYGVGDVDGDITVVEGGYVRVNIAIRRYDAVEAVESGQMTELSPGYTCRIDATPGTCEFGAYDVIQRDRQYNHLALTKVARGGPDIHLRVDSAGNELPSTGVPMNPSDMIEALVKVGVERADAEKMLVEQKADGGAGLKAAFDAMLEKFDGVSKEKDKLQAKFDEMSSAFESFKKEKAAPPADEPAQAEAGGDEKAAVAKADAADFLAHFNERLPLVKMAEEHKLDSAVVSRLDNAALRKAIVLAANPKARQDAADAYYEAAIDMVPAVQVQERGDSAYQGLNETGARTDSSKDIVPPSVAFLNTLNPTREA